MSYFLLGSWKHTATDPYWWATFTFRGLSTYVGVIATLLLSAAWVELLPCTAACCSPRHLKEGKYMTAACWETSREAPSEPIWRQHSCFHFWNMLLPCFSFRSYRALLIPLNCLKQPFVSHSVSENSPTKNHPKAGKIAPWVKVFATKPTNLSLTTECTQWKKRTNLFKLSSDLPTHCAMCVSHTHKINVIKIKSIPRSKA